MRRRRWSVRRKRERQKGEGIKYKTSTKKDNAHTTQRNRDNTLI